MVLTDTGYSLLLRQLSPIPAEAERQFTLLRRRLLYWFEQRRCAWPDELADETLSRVAQRLAEGVEVQNVTGYALGVAGFVHLEYLRDPAHTQLSLENEPQLARTALQPHDHSAEKELENARLECLKSCLARLPQDERELIQAYYHDNWQQQTAQRKTLAERLKLAPSSLRARVHRLRQRLEACAQRCLKQRA